MRPLGRILGGSEVVLYLWALKVGTELAPLVYPYILEGRAQDPMVRKGGPTGTVDRPFLLH